MDYFSAVLALGGFFLFLVMAILIALYVVESLALYTLAKNNGQDSKMEGSGDQSVIAVISAIIPLVRIIYVFMHRNDTLTEEGQIVE